METHRETELLECRLRMEDLVKMQSLFLPAGSSLGREEFVERACVAVGRGTPEEYGRLFDGVDVSREGRLDWPRLTTFLLLKLCEQDEQARAAAVPRWRAPRPLPSPHREPVQGVALLRSGAGRYLSISKDGVLGVWCDELSLLKSLRLTNESVKPKDLWATAMVVLPNVHKVAVAFTSKEICFYDLLSKQEFSCQYKLQGLRHTPIALDYWSSPQDPDQAVLSLGDVGGKVSVVCFRTAQIALFERPSGAAVEQDATVVIQWADVAEGQQRCCCTSTHTAHGHSWVRRVRFLGPLEAVASCSWSGQGSLVLAWRETEGAPLRVTHFNTHTGISDLDYHPTLNLIATAGLNQHVYLWNPYVTSKPVGVLRGHMSSVVAVRFVLGRRQLLSFSSDKVLRLWDVSSQLCVQRVAGIFPKTQECQTLLFLHEEAGRLLLSFNSQLLLLEAKTEPGRRLTSHESPLTCVLYNSLFRQAISSDASSTITCWLMDTGQKVKQFTRCHGDAEISTMALDGTQTRLFTAGTDGLVKIWDFNGHCHHRLNAGRDQAAEISQVLVLKRTVLVLGWERIITVFRPGRFSKFFVQPSEWTGGVQHRDDVLCAAFRPPQTLVTGSYDGEIIVWNNSTENALRKLRADGRQGLRSKSDWPLLKVDRSAASDHGQSPATSGSSLPPAGQDGPEECQAITRLFFLERQKGIIAAGGADLVSCGMSGLVRFWNTARCILVAEFVAHKRSGSIILTVDGSGRYLVTADVHGGVKVWDLQDYCLQSSDGVVGRAPPLLSTLQPHTDCVTHLETCVHGDQLFLLSTSTDYTVALSYLPGHCVGIFGQEEHWRLGGTDCTHPTEAQDGELAGGEMAESPLTPPGSQGHHRNEGSAPQDSASSGEDTTLAEEKDHSHRGLRGRSRGRGVGSVRWEDLGANWTTIVISPSPREPEETGAAEESRRRRRRVPGRGSEPRRGLEEAGRRPPANNNRASASAGEFSDPAGDVGREARLVCDTSSASPLSHSHTTG
ncbi:WD repeat-containing protein 49-like [Sardina pilchardus]|uniref:WD repeat-containing protein 49-like n=1 Tax=Sardina pilchardus TaxID=27697 RepID=UPI002E0FED27